MDFLADLAFLRSKLKCQHPINAVNAISGIPCGYSSCIATLLLQATCLNNIWLAATVPCLTFLSLKHVAQVNNNNLLFPVLK